MTVAGAPAAQAATGTSVTPAVVTGSGLGFDTADAPSTPVLRAWTASPYRSVNLYFSGSQRYHTSQPNLTPDWVTTVLANGWSLVPTVVDLQAPCATSAKKAMMSTDPATAASQGTAAAQQAAADLQALGLGKTVAYLDLEPFDVSKSSTCAPAVLSFLHAFVKAMHGAGDKAGVYVHHTKGAPTIVADYDNPARPDDIWVAETGTATAATSVIGSKWAHHRMHQYLLDSTETYAGETIGIDRDAIDADVVRATAVTVPAGPAYAYNAIGIPSGSTLKHRAQPNTSAAYVTTSANGDQLDIVCQATGETVDGDYVWDRLTDGTYVSDLYTTTTGRNWVSPAIQKCDTTPPSVTLRAPSRVVVATSVTIGWAAADNPDPDGNPNGEARGISSSTMRFRFASWHGGFGAWHTRTATGSSVKLALSPGYTYCVQVESRDLSGNVSPWSSQSCFVTPLDDRAVPASSAWSRRTKSSFYFHTATDTRRSGVSLNRSKAVATQVGLVATTCAKCGAVRVYLGSRYLGSVNLHAASTHYRQVFLLRAFSRRTGTISVRTTSSRLVQIDGIVISRT